MSASDHALKTGKLTAAEGRKFGFVVGGAFLVLAGITFWRDHAIPSGVFASLGSALVLGALLVPTKLGPVQSAWMKLALMISKVTTPIFMGIIFFLVITPAGLLARLFGHRALVHQGNTSWISRAEGDRQSNLDRQF
jgi:hypothetical protein